MDYSYCSKMFTQGQVDRMRAAATSSIRDNHWSTSNLNAVGAISNPHFVKPNFLQLDSPFAKEKHWILPMNPSTEQ